MNDDDTKRALSEPAHSSNHALRYNDQAHPPPKAGATGGTTKAQAVGGRVQRLVVLLVGALQLPLLEPM